MTDIVEHHPEVGSEDQTSGMKAAAAMYVIYHTIMLAGPVVAYWVWIQPVISQWEKGFNSLFAKSWKMTWISNVILFITVWVLSLLSFIGDPTTGIGLIYAILAKATVYVNAGWQGIVWLVWLIATIKYEADGDDFWWSTGGAWTQWGIWTAVTILVTVGYFAQDTDFILYYAFDLW